MDTWQTEGLLAKAEERLTAWVKTQRLAAG